MKGYVQRNKKVRNVEIRETLILTEMEINYLETRKFILEFKRGILRILERVGIPGKFWGF